MADLGETFDPNEAPENDRNFEPIPAGDYLCQVIESDVVATKAGDGKILKITLEVIDGPHANRKIFENINVRNPNPTAQKIGQAALGELGRAVVSGPFRDPEVLHFRPFIARVMIEPDKTGQYGPRNKVKEYRPAQGAPPVAKVAPAQAQSSAAQAVPPPRAATGSRPWSRPAA